MNTVSNKILPTLVFLFAFAVAPLSSFAQDEQQPPTPVQGKTKPAGATPYPVPPVGSDDQTNQSNPLIPDTTPLTGIQTPTLGTSALNHSYWMPGIQWSGSIQSHGYDQIQNSDWIMNNYLVGNVSLLKAWSGRSQLSLNYSAGGFLTSDSGQGNGYYQKLDLTQSFNWNRWHLDLIDQFSYLPESSFGFSAGIGGLGNPGTGGPLAPVIPGLGGNYIPNQSIYAAIGPRYSNASAVQLTYLASPRSSITMSGSYGLLNFVDAGNVDNNTITGTIGYNYALNPKDTIGVFYKFTSFHYPGQPQAIGDHSFNLAYGKKITGHVGLQLYAGPDFTTSRLSISGDSSSYGVNAGANLQYAFERGTLALGYSHGVSGGSGVLTGTTSDVVNTSLSHQLSRLWSGQVNFGYARNTSLGLTSPNQITFNSYTAGGGINRPLGRNATFALNYNVNIPDYSIPGCTGATCAQNQKLQYITINFQWRTRPFVLP